MQGILRGILISGVGVLYAVAASAADPAVTCESGKLKLASKYVSCRLGAEAKGVKAMASAPDFSKCDFAFSTKWPATEIKAGMGICPSEGDQASVGQRTAYHSDAIATQLGGGYPVDPYSPASGQTTSYGAGDDGDVQPGATLSYQDNEDGTITDLNTGLMWEKKVALNGSSVSCLDELGSCANSHDADNRYTWSAGSTAYDGRVKTIFLEQLNNRCNNDTTLPCTTNADCSVPTGACGFAGHRDWRLPAIKELIGIVDFNIPYPGPTVNAAFDGASCGGACTDLTDPACSCTQSTAHWSSTTYQDFPSNAWLVYFDNGDSLAGGKADGPFVRAVRGGS